MKMKSKNRSSEQSRGIPQSYDSKLETSLSFKFYFSFLAFCFVASLATAEISSEQLDPTNFLVGHFVGTSQSDNAPNVPMQIVKLPLAQQETQPSDIAPVNFAAQVDQKLPQSSFIIAGNPNSHPARQLWQARISIPKDEEDKRSKNQLQRIIKQIRSVEFEPQSKSPEPIIVVELVPTAEPNEILSDTEMPEEPQEKEIESKLPYEPVTDQTLQMLENPSQHPDQLDNPLELGEVLFLSGHPKEAGVFYQEALSRSSSDEASSAQDRAWILFQIGNCLRDDDPPMAIKMYRKLITEYPDSPWTDLAKTQDKLIEWYQKDKPRKLIVESQL